MPNVVHLEGDLHAMMKSRCHVWPRRWFVCFLGVRARLFIYLLAVLISCLFVCLSACVMLSSRALVSILALVGMSMPCFCSPHGANLRQQSKDVVYPLRSDASLGEYARETQSPMIWLKLHKTDLPSSK